MSEANSVGFLDEKKPSMESPDALKYVGIESAYLLISIQRSLDIIRAGLLPSANVPYIGVSL